MSKSCGRFAKKRESNKVKEEKARKPWSGAEDVSGESLSNAPWETGGG